MAISLQTNNTSYSSKTGTSLTISINVGSGSNRFLMVAVFTEYNNATPTATYNSVSMTRTLTRQYDDYHTARHLHIFTLANPSSGSHNFVVSCSNSGLITGGYSVYNGVNQTTPVPTTAYGSKSSSKTCEATLTIANANSWLLATMATGNGHNASEWGVGSGTTKRGFMFGFSTVQAGANYDSNGGLATGSRTLTASNTNADNWGVWIALELAEAAASPSGPAHLKTWNVVAIANIKTINGVPIANVKTWNGIN